MMSKFLKVGDWRLNVERVLFVTPEKNGEIQVVFSDEQYVRLQDDAMRALLRWLDANSETLSGGGAAENTEDANVRRHFLALVGYCEDWADVCTDDRKFSIYMTMLKILAHSGELPTEVPTTEMRRRLDIVQDVCDAGLDDKTAMPHIRDIYQNIMNLADIGAELPEDAS